MAIQGKIRSYQHVGSNTDALNNLSLRGVERRSNPMKNEIAAPLGLAMTCKDIYYARISCAVSA